MSAGTVVHKLGSLTLNAVIVVVAIIALLCVLLATHWPGKPNEDIAVGGWRPIDLEAPPYGLPRPAAMIPEVNEGKRLALFDLSQWQAPG